MHVAFSSSFSSGYQLQYADHGTGAELVYVVYYILCVCVCVCVRVSFVICFSLLFLTHTHCQSLSVWRPNLTNFCGGPEKSWSMIGDYAVSGYDAPTTNTVLKGSSECYLIQTSMHISYAHA